MSSKKESIVSSDGKIVGVDRTKYNEDGSSETTHSEARLNMIGGVDVGKITGHTTNHPDGTSTHREK